ncbi:hypothetical protein AKJ16_DCAP04697 [Drosera capensis]
MVQLRCSAVQVRTSSLETAGSAVQIKPVVHLFFLMVSSEGMGPWSTVLEMFVMDRSVSLGSVNQFQTLSLMQI